MTKKSPVAVILLTCVTFGIYGIIWLSKTAGEMREKGAEIPSFIMMFLPIANLIWMYKYCQGIEKVTGGDTSAGMALIMWFLLGVIAMAIFQSKFNEVA